MSVGELKLGLLLPTRGVVLAGEDPVPARRALDAAVMAEEMGLDSVWVGDSLTAKPRLEPLAVLAAVAGVTSRVRLGTAVLLAALRHPVLLAQTAATVDLLSQGRLTLAVGVGGAFNPEQQQEWAAAGVDRRRRAGRLEEVVDVARQLWTGDAVTFHGRHFTLEETSIGFRPRQRPGVPLLLATHAGPGREAQYARAARLADGIISISNSPEELAQVRGRVLGEREALGLSSSPFQAVYYMTVNLGGDPGSASAEADRWVKAYYGLNFWGGRWGPYGPPGALVERVRQYAAAGADQVILRFASYDLPGQLDLLRREVLPALR